MSSEVMHDLRSMVYSPLVGVDHHGSDLVLKECIMSALCLNAVHNFHRAVHHQRGSRILNHLTEDPQNHLHVRAPAKRQFSHCQSLLRNRLLQLLEGLRGMGLPDNVCSRTPVHPFVTDACADESPTCKLLSTAASSVLRASLAQQHLQTLKHILGVRSTVNTHVLWQEVPVKRQAP